MRESILLVVVAAIFLSLCGVEARGDFAICTAREDQTRPDVYGDIVVWSDARNRVVSGSDIYGFNFATGKEFVICATPESQDRPDVYGDIVVWSDERNSAVSGSDIYGFNLTTKQEFAICTDPGAQERPVIYGDIVVWEAAVSGVDGYNLATQQQFSISSTGENPAIHGDIVVYEYAGIRGYNLATQESFDISSGGETADIYEDIVVWSENLSGYPTTIYAYNLTTSQKFAVSPGAYPQYTPAIYGDIVVWTDYRNSGTSDDRNIYGYNLTTGEEFVVCTAHNSQDSPAIYDDVVVWRNFRDGDGIYGHQLRDKAEPEFAEQITVGQVAEGSTANAVGGDITLWGYNDLRDVWYYFIPDANDNYTVSLCGSSFDTTLAIFDETLVEVEYNDDFCDEQSKLIFKGIAGRKYYVRIAGFDADIGDYILNITTPDPLPPLQDQITTLQQENAILQQQLAALQQQVDGLQQIVNDNRDAMEQFMPLKKLLEELSSPEGIPGDVNNDGKVDHTDLAILSSHWLEGTQ